MTASVTSTETSLDAPLASRREPRSSRCRDHTQFRQYASQLARWLSPDPAGLLVADPANPQSWNRYSYVLNNPMNLIDPFGLCDVVVGGFTQTPDTASTQNQRDFAAEIGANQAYPFSGLGPLSSFASAYGQLAKDVTRNAILNAAAQSGGQPFTIYALSGGAQEVANVWSSLPQTVRNQASVFYISPGRVPLGASLPSGAIVQGQGPVDSFLTALSPNGSSMECGHNANCEFGALWSGGVIGRNNVMRAPQACPVPKTFTRQNPGGGRGGGSSGSSGGWIFWQPWLCGSEGCFVGAGIWIPSDWAGGGFRINVLY